jgi:5-methylcytosine-specific restriction endonuclease McrA
MSIGGGNEETNLEVLCVSCNSKEYHLLVKKALKEYFKSYFV